MEDWKFALTLAVPLLTFAALWGEMRSSQKTSEKNADDHRKETAETAKRVEAMHNEAATEKQALRELTARHAELAGEARNRISAVEGRVSTVERESIEIRAELRALATGQARIESKQDRESQAIESIRRDVMIALGKMTKGDPLG